jgi:5-methylcytosine-specific restriction endonuclease McrA
MCGWDETSLDIHHIVERKNGGSNEMSNLIAVCPNCHRKAHEKKYSKDQLFEKSLDKKLPNWYELYEQR